MRVATLSADLVANTTSFEAGLRRSNTLMNQSKSVWSKAIGQSQREFGLFSNGVDRSVSSIVDLRTQLGFMASGLAGALSAQKVIQYSDRWRQLEGRRRIVSDGMQQVRAAQESLFEIAQRTRQPLESVITLYTKLNQSVGEYGRKQYDVAGIAETISMALAVTGEGSAQAASAILQFSQAVQSDFKASSQEINSLLDSAPRLAMALQQAFGSSGKSLKQLAADGELSTDKVMRALEPLAAQGRKIRGEFDQLSMTTAGAITLLDNAFLKFIGQSDMINSGTSSLALGIS